MLEFEKKVLLNKSEFDFLKSILKSTEMVRQVNYYYDTASFEMNDNSITCRIREKDGVYSAVIKEHHTQWQDCSIENVCFSGDTYNDEFFKSMGLVCHGILSTNRMVVHMGNITLMLDKNTYLGIEDYELEIEYDAEFENEAEQVLQNLSEMLAKHKYLNDQNDLSARNISAHKSCRFFTAKKIQHK